MDSYTLSNIEANFLKDLKLIGEMSPYLDFEFGLGSGRPQIFKTTMVKKGGINCRWTQPVLLTGTGSTNLKVVAKSHHSLGKDKTIGLGTIDLAAAAQSATTTVPLATELGKNAGQVRFVVTQGGGAGTTVAPTPGPDGVVEGVGGEGLALDSPGGSGQNLGPGGSAASVGVGQGYGTGPGVAGDYGGVGSGLTPGEQGGIGAGQVVPQQQGGLAGAQQGGLGGRPQEAHEMHSHSTHDHDESESSEVRTVG